MSKSELKSQENQGQNPSKPAQKPAGQKIDKKVDRKIDQTSQSRSDKPRSDKPRSDKPRSDKPRSDKPYSDKPRSDKPRSDKPRSDKPRSDRPRTDKPRTDKSSTSVRSASPKSTSGSAKPTFIKTKDAFTKPKEKVIPAPVVEIEDEDEDDWFDENLLADFDADEDDGDDFESDFQINRNPPKINTSVMTEDEDDGDVEGFKCGFVTLIGAPNVGKSTLLNRLIGETIAITSYRPQTTRNRIPGVYTNDESQIIFIDTPGLHEGKSVLSKYMGKIAIDSIADSDIVALLIEAGVSKDLEVGISQTAKQVLDSLKEKGKKVFLIVNKIDRIPKEHILPVIDTYRSLFDFQEIVPISGLTGNGIEDLIALFAKYLPVGPALYPKDHLTDLPERFFAAEMIREQLFRRLSQEVPYATAVTIDSWLDQGAGGIHIEATIHVERDSQKGIIIGKGGQQLKLIGTNARQKLEKLLNTRVHLHLLVRVEPKWTHSEKSMKKLGYEEKK